MAASSNKASVLKTALQRFRASADAFSDQRRRDLEVQRFQAGDQWTEDAKQQRGGQVVNGMPLPARPMLTIPKLNQPTQLVINQMRNAHLGVLIHPENDEANDDTAEILQGLYRHIEVSSRAQIARNWADERAVVGGLGFYRVLTVPAEHSGDEFDQDIRITRILNQASVYVDPFAQEADFSDMEWGFIGGFLPKERFLREYPKATLTDSEDFTSLGDQAPAWYTSSDSGDAIRVMEYFYVEHTPRTKIAYTDAEGAEQRGYRDELGEDFDESTITHRMPRNERKVCWVKMTGVEILEEQDWNGQYIPIIPTVGIERNVDGDRRWEGVVGPAMDAARLYNYSASDMVEKTALATKAPWIGAEGQFEGHEGKWNQANVRNFPYLEYKPVTLAGSLAPPPARNLGSVDLSPQLMMLQQADDFINSTTFVHEPSKGQTNANRSGKAVLALQQQSDQGNSNYLDNKATISMPYEAKVILDLIPKIYDRPGRVARILGIDDTESRVMLNAPFVTDPQTQRPMPAPPNAPGAKHYDLTKGAYSVTVSVGKAWQTRMQQGADEIQQILQAAPNLLPLIGDIYFKFRDFPGHTEIAERLKKMAPPPIQALLNEGQQPDASQLQAQLQQQGQQMQAMQQQLQQMAQALEMEQAKEAAETQRAQMETAAKVEIERVRAESKLETERMKADLDQKLLLMQAQIDAANREDEQRHDVAMAAAEAHHATGQAARQHEQAESSAERAAERDAMRPVDE